MKIVVDQKLNYRFSYFLHDTHEGITVVTKAIDYRISITIEYRVPLIRCARVDGPIVQHDPDGRRRAHHHGRVEGTTVDILITVSR